MNLAVVTAPTEPVTVTEAKDYANVTSSDEDALFSTLVTAARRQVEAVTGRALGEQTLRLTIPCWPGGGTVPLPLPRPPLASVTSIKVYDDDGTAAGSERTLSGSDYVVVTNSEPGEVYLAETVALSLADRPDAVRVEYVCGYGATGVEGLPQELALAVRALVRHWYDNRTPVQLGTIATEVPKTFEFLTSMYRVPYRLPE